MSQKQPPNEFARSIRSGVCAVCAWKAETHPDYDPAFAENHMAIHFAKGHPGDLPFGLVQGVAEYLRTTERFGS